MVCAAFASSGPARCEAVLHGHGTSPLEGAGAVPTCDSVHSWQLYSADSLENQAAGTMTCYPTQSYHPDNEQTSPCHILIMSSARLGSDRYQF